MKDLCEKYGHECKQIEELQAELNQLKEKINEERIKNTVYLAMDEYRWIDYGDKRNVSEDISKAVSDMLKGDK